METKGLILKIEEKPTRLDFLGFIKILVSEGHFTWLLYVFIIKLLRGKNNGLRVIKINEEVVGGLFITDIPLEKYKLYNISNKEVKQKIHQLMEERYFYFCCFIVKKQYRNKGLGTFVFTDYMKAEHKKIWFTSLVLATRFYERNGAKIFYVSPNSTYKYDIYYFDGM
jgi:ribosomal protein S18 acetylase RimI-like enzyme